MLRHSLLLIVAVFAVPFVSAGCGETSKATGPGPSPDDQPPAFDAFEFLYRTESSYAVLQATAVDPDGTDTTIACTGTVETAGTGSVSDSLVVAPAENEQTLTEECVATSNGASATRSGTAIVPANQPPSQVETVLWTFRVFDLVDHDAALTTGGLRIQVDGKDTTLQAATDGSYVLEVAKASADGALVPAASATIDYADANHSTPLQVLRRTPAQGVPYGERLGAAWTDPLDIADLPREDAAFELFVAPDDFPRDRYFRLTTGADADRPLGSPCANADPSGIGDGKFSVSFLIDDQTSRPVPGVNADRVRTALRQGLPGEVSTGLRYRLQGTEAGNEPAFPFLRVTGDFVPSPGTTETGYDGEGCLVAARYAVPSPQRASDDPSVPLADVERQILRALFFPFGDAADITALVDSSGAYSQEAADMVAATVAIGASPDFFQR